VSSPETESAVFFAKTLLLLEARLMSLEQTVWTEKIAQSSDFQQAETLHIARCLRSLHPQFSKRLRDHGLHHIAEQLDAVMPQALDGVQFPTDSVS